MKAFVPYSIDEKDAHLVYDLGGVLARQGYEVEYNYDLAMGQRAFDEVSQSMFFAGIITHPLRAAGVVRLWQFAQSQGIPAFLIVEDKVKIPTPVAKHKDVYTFRRYIPENPIKFIELYFSLR